MIQNLDIKNNKYDENIVSTEEDLLQELKIKIENNELCDSEIKDILSCNQEKKSNEIISNFIEDNTKIYVCYGSSSMCLRHHYIYRHINGELYTFNLYGYVGEKVISNLRRFDI